MPGVGSSRGCREVRRLGPESRPWGLVCFVRGRIQLGSPSTIIGVRGLPTETLSCFNLGHPLSHRVGPVPVLEVVQSTPKSGPSMFPRWSSRSQRRNPSLWFSLGVVSHVSPPRDSTSTSCFVQDGQGSWFLFPSVGPSSDYPKPPGLFPSDLPTRSGRPWVGTNSRCGKTTFYETWGLLDEPTSHKSKEGGVSLLYRSF